MKILIADGSPLTMGIIDFLSAHRHNIMLVDPDREHCEKAAQFLGHPVLNGNPWETDSLGKVKPSQFDLLIAATGRDENNLLTCELAKELSFNYTIALIDNPSHISAFHHLGIDQVICTPRIVYSFIAQALSTAQESLG